MDPRVRVRFSSEFSCGRSLMGDVSQSWWLFMCPGWSIGRQQCGGFDSVSWDRLVGELTAQHTTSELCAKANELSRTYYGARWHYTEKMTVCLSSCLTMHQNVQSIALVSLLEKNFANII